ncbi:hypothetical protein H0O00_03430 [Candidatus Micrarchaeota archaeon]|nr:hypothetical protein [Candidatus Micrarchaeota archaeon]
MALSLICPKCRSAITSTSMPPRVGLTMPARCPRCGDVDAFILHSGAEAEGDWAKETEPTKEVEEEADVLASVIPAVGALYVLGNAKEVTKLIVLRLISFGLLFILFGGTFAISLSNPYFAVLASCAFILLAHASFTLSDRLNPSAIIKKYDIFVFFGLSAWLLVILGPLLAFEILLLALSPIFFLVDLVIAVVAFTAILEKKTNA